jgi:hypothetical protein
MPVIVNQSSTAPYLADYLLLDADSGAFIPLATQTVTQMEFSPDSKYLEFVAGATADSNNVMHGTLRLYRTSDGVTLTGPNGIASALLGGYQEPIPWAPDGSGFLVSDTASIAGGTLYYAAVGPSSLTLTALSTNPSLNVNGTLRFPFFSPDGKKVITFDDAGGGCDYPLRLFDTATMTSTKLSDHANPWYNIGFSPDSKKLLYLSECSTNAWNARLTDLATGATTWALRGVFTNQPPVLWLAGNRPLVVTYYTRPSQYAPPYYFQEGLYGLIPP